MICGFLLFLGWGGVVFMHVTIIVLKAILIVSETFINLLQKCSIIKILCVSETFIIVYFALGTGVGGEVSKSTLIRYLIMLKGNLRTYFVLSLYYARFSSPNTKNY